MMVVNEHVQRHTITEIAITPAHGERNTTAFRHSVNRLKEDGHYQCFVTGRTDNLQVHHICEFSLEHCFDFKKVKAFLLKHDIYGYSNLLKNTEITTVDDVRNMMVLNQDYHTGVDKENGSSGIGVHDTTWPAFVAQCVCKEGFNPVPQRGEKTEDVMRREGTL
jgi:hypothetical protein